MSKLTHVWVQRVLGSFSFNRRLLAWDSYECHMVKRVKEALAKIKVVQRLYEVHQAADVCWNKPFKALVSEQYDDWMANAYITTQWLIICGHRRER